VNTDGDEDSLAPAAPPPMDPSFMKPAAPDASCPSSLGQTRPPAAMGYSLAATAGKRRGRGYVDVNAKLGATTASTAPPMLLDPVAPGSVPMSPSILTPGIGINGDDGPGSIPTSVDAAPPPSENGPASLPMMFNPSSYGSVAEPPAF